MKKLATKKLLSILLIFCLSAATVFCFVACDEDTDDSPIPLDIDLAAMPTQLAAYNQTNDINHNPDNYGGKVVRIKGTFSRTKLNGGTTKHNFVDVSDGCNCGNPAAWVTFTWDGDLPKAGADVTVIGTIRTGNENGNKYAEIVAQSVKF